MARSENLRCGAVRLPGAGLVIVVLLIAAPSVADEGSGDLLGGEDQAVVARRLAAALRETYVLGDRAEAMAERLEARIEAGAYGVPSSRLRLAALLTRDVRTVHDDKHLLVLPLAEVEDARAQWDGASARRRNFGFRLVEILDGNVGYLQLRRFADPAAAGGTAAAAMALLANCEALIIDLRDNGGGSPFMVQLLASYLLDAPPRHLVDHYRRQDDSTRQIHSLAWVPGQRLSGIPVFVLTSSRTFSAAEGFTYLVQSLKRATVVGERTAGGAHPVQLVELGDGLAAWIPYARAINPSTGTNWEGVGVAPDIAVAEEQALAAAYGEALRSLAESSVDAARRRELQEILERLGGGSR